MAKIDFYSLGLKPIHSFDHLVIGSHNEIAAAACRQAAEKPGDSYNPVFLYGPSGVGKTHLMQAVALLMLAQRPECRIKYISSERFVNEVISAVGEDRIIGLRQEYGTIDLFMLDDLQYLVESRIAMVELLHIFNNLHQLNRQIIFAADEAPQLLRGLEQNFQSRLAWGLAVDVRCPDKEARLNILRRKQADYDLNLGEEALSLVAEVIGHNVREIEGFIKRINAYVTLTRQELTLALVKNIINEIRPGVLERMASMAGPGERQGAAPPAVAPPPVSPHGPVAPPQAAAPPPPAPPAAQPPVSAQSPSAPPPPPPPPAPSGDLALPAEKPLPPPTHRERPVPPTDAPGRKGSFAVPPESLVSQSGEPPPFEAPSLPKDAPVPSAPQDVPERMDPAPDPFAEAEEPAVGEGFKEVRAVFFCPSKGEEPLDSVHAKFQEVIKKHKLKFRLKRAASHTYDYTGKINYAQFVEACKASQAPVAIVIGPPPDAPVANHDFYDVLSVTLDVQGISLQMVGWSEIKKDYRFLNLALDIALVRAK